ncbi:MAG: hypothetical protein WC231_05045 [Dehalococcoidales bacterium]|nr:hypothetical protein [Dehalococcoidales bacterium]MDD5604502.1 hypothetical protein [Dehalococcoidales bacterium]MDX9986715.1 hypothetical protein [Dehalococcoidales bacterium]NLE90503.1 hypothetical protein [Dehalococcoidales bacterium]
MSSRDIIKPVVMVIGLVICGLAAGFLAAFIASRVFEGDAGGWGGLVGAIVGMAAGYPLGVVLGMVATRWIIKYPGSLLLGIPGVLIVPVLCFALAELIGNPDFIFGSMFIVSPLVGTIAYHLRR